jgi:hypothetical protein
MTPLDCYQPEAQPAAVANPSVGMRCLGQASEDGKCVFPNAWEQTRRAMTVCDG